MHCGRVLRDIGEGPPGRPARARDTGYFGEIDDLKTARGFCLSHGIMILPIDRRGERVITKESP